MIIAQFQLNSARFLFIAIMSIVFCSCGPEIVFDTVEIKRNDWGEINILDIYRDDSWSSFSKNKKFIPKKRTITLYREDGTIMENYNSKRIVFDDGNLKNEERIGIKIKSQFPKATIEKDTFIIASPKRIKIDAVIDYPIEETYRDFRHSLNIIKERKVFQSYDNYEKIEDMPPNAQVNIDIAGLRNRKICYLRKNNNVLSFDFSNQSLMKNTMYANEEVDLDFRYTYSWEENVDSLTISKKVRINPEFVTLINNYKYPVHLRPYEAKYIKFFIPEYRIGVLTFRGNQNTDNLDIVSYTDSELTDIKYETTSTANRDILFQLGSDHYVYAKIINRSEKDLNGSFVNHVVDYEEVLKNTAIDYGAQYLIRQAINWFFGVEENSSFGNNFSETASNIVVSSIRGNNEYGITKNVMVNKIQNEIRKNMGYNEAGNILVTFTIHFFDDIYKYY